MQSFIEEFDTIDPTKWQVDSGYRIPGNTFGCTWRAENAVASTGKLRLSLNNDTGGGDTPYSGASIKTIQKCGYGVYDVNMRPIKNIGIVSSFFTFIGPPNGYPQDEIDIEFLGKDTTKVQFNYYVLGQGGHEYIHNLGFDASLTYHNYSIHWKPDHIGWYVDGTLVHTATGIMPSHEGYLMMNVWNAGSDPGVQSWLGTYNGTVPLTASYARVAYTATW